jgi:hypothetical protein
MDRGITAVFFFSYLHRWCGSLRSAGRSIRINALAQGPNRQAWFFESGNPEPDSGTACA